MVSAGVKEVVNECFNILQSQNQSKLNVQGVVELCMSGQIFGKNGVVVGFEEPTIMTTNKHLFVTHMKYPEIRKGNNAIVMGDLVEDLNMIKGLELKTVISIGFCNAKDSDTLEKYMNAFDVVVVNDGNLVLVEELVAAISGLSSEVEEATSGKAAEWFFHCLN